MKVSTYIGAVMVLAIAGLYQMKSPINPVVVTLPPLPEQTLTTSPNTPQLSESQYLWDDFTPGPEAFAVDDEGLLYTGLADGRIVQLDPTRTESEPVLITFTGDPNKALPFPCGKYQTEHLCGRPLGMDWDSSSSVAKRAHAGGHTKGSTKRGNLIVADSYFGLISVDIEEKKITKLTNHVKGEKRDLQFTNDLEISTEGIVYFTDSSKYQRRDFIYDILEGTRTGRLLKYDPKDLSTTVLASGLAFANGVLLTADESKLIFAETTAARISVYHLTGSKKGQVEVLLDNLPGAPDNLAWTDESKTEFYVACAYKRTKPFALADFLAPYPSIRTLIAKLIPPGGGWILSLIPKEGVVFKITLSKDQTKGTLTQTFFDNSGRTKLLSIAYPHKDRLYLGTHSPTSAYVAAVPNPKKKTK